MTAATVMTPVLAAPLRSDDRIIEVAPRDARVARQLAEAGRHRYLALAEDDALSDLRSEAGELRDRFRPLSEAHDLHGVSADALILHGRAIRYLWLPSELRGVRTILVPVDSPEAWLAGRFQRLTRTLRPVGQSVLAERRYRVFEIPGYRARPRTRVHFSPVVGYPGLISRLDIAGVRAVVLRWFEDLPSVEAGEDLDLLVADEDLDTVRAIIAEEPGTLPIDLYSISGLPGSDRQGLACYPPELAQRIVSHAVRHRSGAWIPAPDDHLHSLAYHAVYHKGEASGLPSSSGTGDGVTPEHDYGAVLSRIAKEIGVEIPSDLDGLDEYLDTAGWRPPADTLRRLSTANRWVKERYFSESPDASDEPQTAVFVLRQRALGVVELAEVQWLLDHLGFEILDHRTLDPEAAKRCRTQLRGGNWGQGPYPTSGGPPSSAFVTLHYGPRPANANSRKTYPHLTNLEVLVAKEMLRDLVNKRVSPEQRCNPVHSSDNEEEAWEYVNAAMPDALPRLQAMVDERRAEYRTPLPVVKLLNRGRRAKVELVEVDGDLAVRKTFGRGYVRHLKREKHAHRVLASHPGMPPLLASGDNWILRPYYRDRLGYREGRPSLIPSKILREMVDILRALHEAGFALIDAKPDNFVMDHNGVKLIDFEFMYEYGDDPPPFHKSYTWHSPPSEVVVDRPVGPLSYGFTWMRWTGMPVDVLCHATPGKQRAFRASYRVKRLAHIARHGPMRLASLIGGRGRGLRVRVQAKYRSWARTRAKTALSP